MWAFGVSFAVIFVAELGDKSQLMAMTFATRFRPLPVLAGITVATAVVHPRPSPSATALGVTLPTSWIAWSAGVAFLGFGAWTLRGDALTEDEKLTAGARALGVPPVGIAFFLAELGDKTMLATITLATRTAGSAPGSARRSAWSRRTPSPSASGSCCTGTCRSG